MPAISKGDHVALKVTSTGFLGSSTGPSWQQQPPFIALANTDSTGTPELVPLLWQNGTTSSSIDVALLDVLTDPDANEFTRLNGKFVQVDGYSPEYQGIVISMFKRAGGATQAIVRTNVGTYMELASASLTEVTGR